MGIMVAVMALVMHFSTSLRDVFLMIAVVLLALLFIRDLRLRGCKFRLVSGLVKVINTAFVVFNVERLLDTDNGYSVRVSAVSESRPLLVSLQFYQYE